jgi:microcystin-dependent protein
MAVLTKGHDFSDGEQVTSAKLDAAVDSATFAAGSVDNVSTQLSGGGIIVKDGGVGTSKIADSSVTTPKIADSSVTTPKIADDAITPSKLSAGAPTWNSNQLILNGTDNATLRLISGDNTSFSSIDFGDPQDNNIIRIVGEHQDNSLRLFTDDTERMRINSDGHITGSFVSAYPVGSIYMNASNSTNPSTLLGFGTWVSFGAGRVLVGIDGSQSEFNSIGETGGYKTHVLTTSQIPSHTHSVDPPNTTTSSSGSHSHTYQANKDGGVNESTDNRNGSNKQPAPASTFTTNTVGNHTHTVNISSFTSGSSGSGGSHNNLQPYITVYMWTRTA